MRMSNTPQGGTIEGNPARRGTDEALMVNQGVANATPIPASV